MPPADSDVLDPSRSLPDGMYGATFVGTSEMTPQTLADHRDLAERARRVFPRAEVVVNRGAPVDTLASGAGPGGYLVLLDGPFEPEPATRASGSTGIARSSSLFRFALKEWISPR